MIHRPGCGWRLASRSRWRGGRHSWPSRVSQTGEQVPDTQVVLPCGLLQVVPQASQLFGSLKILRQEPLQQVPPAQSVFKDAALAVRALRAVGTAAVHVGSFPLLISSLQVALEAHCPFASQISPTGQLPQSTGCPQLLLAASRRGRGTQARRGSIAEILGSLNASVRARNRAAGRKAPRWQRRLPGLQP
jgi:hypothetical protein